MAPPAAQASAPPDAADDVAIDVCNLSKCYRLYRSPMDRLLGALSPGRGRADEVWALRDVTFQVRRGETVGVVGRNGAGKSTLLQLVTGTLTPTTGRCQVKGRVAAMLELGAGFEPEFSGLENVFLNAGILGLGRREVEARLPDIAAFAELGDFLHRPVKTYSSGMFMRLAFAVAAHVDADVLIVDEALSVGDAFFTQKCMRFLEEFQRRGTLLFVSHDSNAVMQLCRRAVWIDGGRLRESGEPRMVCEHYLEELYAERAGADAADRRVSRTLELPPPGQAALVKRAPALGPVRADGRRQAQRLDIAPFDPNARSFGIGGARIAAARLVTPEGTPLTVLRTGDPVALEVEVEVETELTTPIVGFIVKNRLGQELFGDNTFRLDAPGERHRFAAGDRIRARFEFQMPLLPGGDYAITAAIAEGTNADHVQRHWVHEALAFTVTAESNHYGLIGIPMQAITLERVATGGSGEPDRPG